jgi:hypothetical protein
MRGKLLTGTLAVLAIAGCGSTKYITQTQTQTQTTTATQTQTQTTTVVKHTSAPVTDTVTVVHTVTAAASSGGSGGYASTYPITFESSFDQSCTNGGETFSACACILKQIEATVPYSTMAASAHAIFTGNPPSWFTDAASSCG